MPTTINDLIADLKDEAAMLINANRKKFGANTQDLIDFCTAELCYFKDDGLSHFQIKSEVSRQAA